MSILREYPDSEYPVVLTFSVPRRFAPHARIVTSYWQEQEIMAKAARKGWALVSRDPQAPETTSGPEP